MMRKTALRIMAHQVLMRHELRHDEFTFSSKSQRGKPSFLGIYSTSLPRGVPNPLAEPISPRGGRGRR
jgi:hypothetical protein